MHKNAILMVAGILVVLASAAFVMHQSNGSPSSAHESANVSGANVEPNVSGSASSSGSQTTATKTYTAADVAAHGSPSSCWTIIRGSVYDLTAWIPQHPGGEQHIIDLCGRDGTQDFVGQHGGSPRQESILATFKIGELAS